jgi:hypothetical protein
MPVPALPQNQQKQPPNHRAVKNPPIQWLVLPGPPRCASIAVLFTTWKAFTEEQKTRNGSPDGYMERFYEKYNSPEKISYAKVDLITFAWGNCANETLTHLNRDEKTEIEFNKLFRNIKTACEEP